jgi:hypothetical protein
MNTTFTPVFNSNFQSLEIINTLNPDLIIGLNNKIDENYSLDNYYKYLENKTLIFDTVETSEPSGSPTLTNIQAFYFQEIDGVMYDDISLFSKRHEILDEDASLVGNEIAISSKISNKYGIKKGDTRSVKISRVDPIITVSVKYIFNEADFLLRTTIKNYQGFDKGESGVILYSKDIITKENNSMFLKFSVGDQSFNYSQDLSLIKEAFKDNLIKNYIQFILLLTPFFIILFLNSSIFIYKRFRYLIHKFNFMSLLLKDMKIGYFYIIIQYFYLSLYLSPLLIYSILLLVFAILFNIVFNRKVILWLKVSR